MSELFENLLTSSVAVIELFQLKLETLFTAVMKHTTFLTASIKKPLLAK